MPPAVTYVFYTLIFLSIYVQVFFLVTFFDKRKQIVIRTKPITLKRYPTVTVIVPCWNEQATLEATVESLLALDYPEDKLQIFLVDDGSTDNTWQVMQQYAKHPQIEIYQKENGGKHTAMNWGIQKATSEYVSCLDADSFVHPEALKRIMTYFDNPEVAAVAPSILIRNPKTIIQRLQKVEYDWAVYTKKMLGFVGGIHVTPGPFSVYRRDMCIEIGMFKKAHNTEDMEFAYRMQANHYRIEQSNDAYVYTVAPSTVYKLYKQRLRWIYGFIQNTIDYRHLLFKKKYGTFSLFTVPAGVVSVIAVPFMIFWLVYRLVSFIIDQVEQIQAVGFQWPKFSLDFGGPSGSFDWFFINTNTTLIVAVVVYFLVITAMVLGKRIAYGKGFVGIGMIAMMLVYSVIAPFWVLKALFNSISRSTPKWR